MTEYLIVKKITVSLLLTLLYSTRHNDWRQCILKLRPLASKCHKLEVSSSFSSKDMAFNNISVIYGHCQLNIAQWASQKNVEIQWVF